MRILFEVGLLLIISLTAYSVWKYVVNFPTKKPKAKKEKL